MYEDREPYKLAKRRWRALCGIVGQELLEQEFQKAEIVSCFSWSGDKTLSFLMRG